MNDIDATNLNLIPNDGTEPLYPYSYGPVIWVKRYYDDTPIMPGYMRIYEFMHGYDDVLISEFKEGQNDPLIVILQEEIQKEINKAVIQQICDKSRGG